jgi:glycosyltransferase involved in cell wall biosynthesis
MRILHVFPVEEVGGAEQVSLTLMRHRQDPRFEHHAVILAPRPGALGEALTSAGIPYAHVLRGRMRHPAALLRARSGLRRAVRAIAPDWVLANSPQGFLYARLAVPFGPPRVALYYMTVPRSRLLANPALDVLMAVARPAMTLTASRRIADTLADWGLPHVEAVHHGAAAPVATADLRTARDRILREAGVPPDAPVVLLPGRLQRWKGQHVLVAAMPAILARVPDAHAVLLGGTLFGMEPAYRPELTTLARRLHIAHRVHLVGHHPVAAWLERAAVVVHASIAPDPFPNVCIETLAAGRPLVTTRESGVCEIVDDEVHALVVRPGDPCALARAVTRLLQDGTLATRLAAAGLACHRSRATADLMAARIEHAFCAFDARPGTAPDAAHGRGHGLSSRI